MFRSNHESPWESGAAEQSAFLGLGRRFVATSMCYVNPEIWEGEFSVNITEQEISRSFIVKLSNVKRPANTAYFIAHTCNRTFSTLPHHHRTHRGSDHDLRPSILHILRHCSRNKIPISRFARRRLASSTTTTIHDHGGSITAWCSESMVQYPPSVPNKFPAEPRAPLRKVHSITIVWGRIFSPSPPAGVR